MTTKTTITTAKLSGWKKVISYHACQFVYFTKWGLFRLKYVVETFVRVNSHRYKHILFFWNKIHFIFVFFFSSTVFCLLYIMNFIQKGQLAHWLLKCLFFFNFVHVCRESRTSIILSEEPIGEFCRNWKQHYGLWSVLDFGTQITP